MAEPTTTSSPTTTILYNTTSVGVFSRIVPNRKQWQRSIVRRLEAFLDHAAGDNPPSVPIHNTTSSNFFQEHPERMDVARLQRAEVCVDQYIATGSFSDVFQVSGFDLDERDDEMTLLPEQQMARRRLDQTAKDEMGESRFVIKSVRRSLASEPHKVAQAAASLVMEAKFLSRFDHDNILKLRGCSWDGGTLTTSEDDYASCQTGDHFFILLDRVEWTLSDRIKQWKDTGNKSLSLSSLHCRNGDLCFYEERLRYALEMANALAYLHERRIIYRDLKPPNIGLTRDNHVQLFDFGLCRELPRPSQAFGKDERFQMTCAGTRRYMAPEVLTRRGYNLKADVYSWSMVLYEMISLRQPYESYNRDLHYMLACEEGRRPKVKDEWPLEIVQLLQAGWSQALSSRSDIVQMQQQVKTVLANMGKTPSKEIIAVGSVDHAMLRVRAHTRDNSNASLDKLSDHQLILSDCSSFTQSSDDHTLSHGAFETVEL